MPGLFCKTVWCKNGFKHIKVSFFPTKKRYKGFKYYCFFPSANVTNVKLWKPCYYFLSYVSQNHHFQLGKIVHQTIFDVFACVHVFHMFFKICEDLWDEPKCSDACY